MGTFIGSWGWRNTMIVLLVVSFAAILVLSYVRSKPDNSQQIIADIREQLMVRYDQEMKARDSKIKELTNRLTVSDQKYKVIVKKLKELKDEYANVAPPQSNSEIRARFSSMGYSPLP
ncbi:MAG: hypothetical protein ACOYOS_00260 [Syntrophales bacterium]